MKNSEEEEEEKNNEEWRNSSDEDFQSPVDLKRSEEFNSFEEKIVGLDEKVTSCKEYL